MFSFNERCTPCRQNDRNGFGGRPNKLLPKKLGFPGPTTFPLVRRRHSLKALPLSPSTSPKPNVPTGVRVSLTDDSQSAFPIDDHVIYRRTICHHSALFSVTDVVDVHDWDREDVFAGIPHAALNVNVAWGAPWAARTAGV